MAKDRFNNRLISNRKASFDYHFIETFTAGIMLSGTEIKSIRQGLANLNDSFCYLKDERVFVKNFHVSPYVEGSFYNHDPMREKELLLNKREIVKLINKTKEKGISIIPTKMFINERGFAKLEIALAKGKKQFDKREDIKAKDVKRDMERDLK